MKAKDNFFVIAQSALASDEWKVLGLLYLPILGSKSFTLYHTLYHLLNGREYKSDVYNHQFLSDILNEKIGDLKIALEKLEAINLLSTFKDQDNYVYQLKSPLSPRGFFQDTILGHFLKTEIGSNYYNLLSSQFKVKNVDLSTYEEVTKIFDDVYNFVPSKSYKDDSMYLGRKSNKGSIIKDIIDYEKFVESLPNRLKKPILYHFNTKNKLQKLAYVYKLNIEELVEIYTEASYNTGDIDINRLSFIAQKYYENKKDSTTVTKIDEPSNSNPDKIRFLNTVSPLDIIESYAKNDYQLMATDTVLQLLERNQVEPGVLNALLLHILKFKQGELPHINYLEKVLETWYQKGIKTTEDAYLQIITKDDYKRPKSKASSKDTPTWVYDYLDELDDNKEEDDG